MIPINTRKKFSTDDMYDTIEFKTDKQVKHTISVNTRAVYNVCAALVTLHPIIKKHIKESICNK